MSTKKREFKIVSFDSSGTMFEDEIESSTIEGAKKKSVSQVFGKMRAFYIVDEQERVKWKMEIGDWRRIKMQD